MFPLALSQQLSYNAITGGSVFSPNGISRPDTQLLVDLRATPQLITELNLSSKDDRQTLQTRHMAHPMYLPQGQIVTTRVSAVDRSLTNRLIARLLTHSFLAHREIPRGTFFDKNHPDAPYNPTALRDLYQLIYQEHIDPFLQEAPLDLSLLPTFIHDANMEGIQVLMRQFPQKIFMNSFETMGGKGTQTGTITTFFPALWEMLHTFKYDGRLMDFAMECLQMVKESFGTLTAYFKRVPQNISQNVLSMVLGSQKSKYGRELQQMGHNTNLHDFYLAASTSNALWDNRDNVTEEQHVKSIFGYLQEMQSLFIGLVDSATRQYALMHPQTSDNSPHLLIDQLSYADPLRATYFLQEARLLGDDFLLYTIQKDFLEAILNRSYAKEETSPLFYDALNNLFNSLPQETMSDLLSRPLFPFPNTLYTFFQLFIISYFGNEFVLMQHAYLSFMFDLASKTQWAGLKTSLDDITPWTVFTTGAAQSLKNHNINGYFTKVDNLLKKIPAPLVHEHLTTYIAMCPDIPQPAQIVEGMIDISKKYNCAGLRDENGNYHNALQYLTKLFCEIHPQIISMERPKVEKNIEEKKKIFAKIVDTIESQPDLFHPRGEINPEMYWQVSGLIRMAKKVDVFFRAAALWKILGRAYLSLPKSGRLTMQFDMLEGMDIINFYCFTRSNFKEFVKSMNAQTEHELLLGFLEMEYYGDPPLKTKHLSYIKRPIYYTNPDETVASCNPFDIISAACERSPQHYLVYYMIAGQSTQKLSPKGLTQAIEILTGYDYNTIGGLVPIDPCFDVVYIDNLFNYFNANPEDYPQFMVGIPKLPPQTLR